jgi:hypothetical protein
MNAATKELQDRFKKMFAEKRAAIKAKMEAERERIRQERAESDARINEE